MTTTLKRFQQAYATMTVAVYEPLIVRWYSGLQVWSMVDAAAKRAVRRKAAPTEMELPTRRREFPGAAKFARIAAQSAEVFDAAAKVPAGRITAKSALFRDAELFREFDALEIAGDTAFPLGTVAHAGKPVAGGRPVAPIPVLAVSSTARDEAFEPDVREKALSAVKQTLRNVVKDGRPGASQVGDALHNTLEKVFKEYGLQREILPLPQGQLLEFLSPVGVAHFYRQLYFYLTEGVGPIEQAFTIAPLETLEVAVETVRRQTHEETFEMGSETVSETAIESKNLDEVSDKVATMVERDTAAAMSANTSFTASGGVGVWQGSVSGSLNGQSSLSQSSQQSREFASRRLKEITKRASERITKTFSLSVKDTTDFTSTNVTKRVIKNDSSEPISYGLRRVFNRVLVKVQDLGPRLVWQLYLREPGAGLAQGKFVHFYPSETIANPGDPPAVRARPTGGSEKATQSATLQWSAEKGCWFVELVILTTSDRKITAVSIDAVNDLEHLAKEDPAPSPRNDLSWDQQFDEAKGEFKVKIGILPGDAMSVSLDYTYIFEPSTSAIDAWQQEVDAANTKFKQQEAEAREKALREEFERKKQLITERSKVRARPAADLRREERYEVMNRMVSHLFRPSGMRSTPTPLEIELFHRYFEVDGLFCFTHPAWWRPRYVNPAVGFASADYEITADSSPARLGSSLGWKLAIDGDDRRNEFLNSPWVRVCVPIKSGREDEAIEWLSSYIEGDIGYDPQQEPLRTLLADIREKRRLESSLGLNGPDYVNVDSTLGAPQDPQVPEAIFPIVDEFEVTIPTEGFVYDTLDVQIP